MKVRKGVLVGYLIGVVVAWICGFNYESRLNEKYASEMTYGDLAAITIKSSLSWVNVAGLTIKTVAELDIWDKPIKSKQVTSNEQATR